MTAVDPRDELTGELKAFVDAALREPAKAQKVADVLLPEGSVPALSGWPVPSVRARRHAQEVVCQAVRSLHNAYAAGLLGSMYTGLDERHFPGRLHQVEVEFKPCSQDEPLLPAPLIAYCLQPEMEYLLAVLITYRFTPHISRRKTDDGQVDLFAGSVRRDIDRRLNAFVFVESNLWFLARLGGLTEPPPYAVRYDLARLLWRRSAPGHILCLRCGEHIHYTRQARSNLIRNGRCRRCSRGESDAWPTHALEPAGRGMWWLHCQTDGCSKPFLGRANRLRCPDCQTSRTTPNKRKPLGRQIDAGLGPERSPN